METIKEKPKELPVKTELGEFILKRPKAGLRNDSYIYAEKANGYISRIKQLIYLIPKCVKKRPDSANKVVPIEQLLNDLEPSDYDNFVDAMDILLNGYPETVSNEETKEAETEKN